MTWCAEMWKNCLSFTSSQLILCKYSKKSFCDFCFCWVMLKNLKVCFRLIIIIDGYLKNLKKKWISFWIRKIVTQHIFSMQSHRTVANGSQCVWNSMRNERYLYAECYIPSPAIHCGVSMRIFVFSLIKTSKLSRQFFETKLKWRWYVSVRYF